ncbi:hypothetical protein CsSME_00003085 [Camellia sinensis var. sinensis]
MSERRSDYTNTPTLYREKKNNLKKTVDALGKPDLENSKLVRGFSRFIYLFAMRLVPPDLICSSKKSQIHSNRCGTLTGFSNEELIWKLGLVLLMAAKKFISRGYAMLFQRRLSPLDPEESSPDAASEELGNEYFKSKFE